MTVKIKFLVLEKLESQNIQMLIESLHKPNLLRLKGVVVLAKLLWRTNAPEQPQASFQTDHSSALMGP